jgi:urease accessory protein
MKALDSPDVGADMRLRSLLTALHLASPALPVGGFAYSQGLETAVANGVVVAADAAQRWIGDLLRHVVARFEAPLWLRAFDADAAGDRTRFDAVNAELLAARETAELRAESLQMGASLCRVLSALGVIGPANDRLVYPAAFAAACSRLGVDREAGLTAYLWAWAENQVLAAVKIVPLGQQAGQVMLFALHGAVLDAVRVASTLKDSELGTAAVGFALCSAQHESQYSRLFRS